MAIQIPYKFNPRHYQVPLFAKIEQGIKRFIVVWHRRAGKDKSCFNLVVREATKTIGIYYYIFPTYSQGRKILWNGIDKSGFRFLDHIPKEIIEGKPNSVDMMIRLKNGSVIQIIGSENIDSIVGTNPIGVVFSEYSLQNPSVWDFIRPILAENGGRALFNFTPRGDNHAKELLDYAMTRPDRWYTSILTVEDTQAIPEEVLEDERKEIIAKNGNDSVFQQEYYCSFDAGIQGSYYAQLLTDIEIKKQRTSLPYEKLLGVNTVWDLGMGDSTAIWFYQTSGKEIRVIDYYENSGEGLEHYVNILQSKGYRYEKHYLPHDAQVRELGTGKSRYEILKGLGIGQIEIVKNIGVDEGIQAVRTLLPYCRFDTEKTQEGRKALKNYKKKWNDRMKTFTGPEHDRASHGSDAFRYLAVSIDTKPKREHKIYTQDYRHML